MNHSDDPGTWVPGPEFRWYTPDEQYVPAVLQRKFMVTLADGMGCEIWAEVDPNNTFRHTATIN